MKSGKFSRFIVGSLAALLLLTACGSQADQAAGSPSDTPSQSSSAPTVESVYEKYDLTPRLPARGNVVLVPSEWTFTPIDGGGSGSWSTWEDPANPGNYIEQNTGVGIGGWYEVDGVNGSVDPTNELPDGAEIVGKAKNIFEYSYSKKINGEVRKVQGIWIANLEYMDYQTLEISLKVDDPELVEAIFNHFEDSRS